MSHPSPLATDAHLPYRVNTATDYDADPSKFQHRKLDGVDDNKCKRHGRRWHSGFFSRPPYPRKAAQVQRTLFSDAGTNTGYIVRLNTSNQLELGRKRHGIHHDCPSGTLAVISTDIIAGMG